MKVAVIGAGPAGYVSALTARRLGAEVYLFEKEELGGTCLNRGCIPTKTLIHSLELIDSTNKLILGSKNISLDQFIDLSSLMERKNYVVETQKKGLSMLLKQSGVRVINSTAELLNPKLVLSVANSEKYEVDRVILATGSKPAKLPLFEFDGERILTSDDLWNLKKIPESIIIIGAGAIGCEFAWIFNLLRSKVYVVELMPRLLPMEDEEVSKALERLFKKRKIEFFTDKKVDDLKKFENYVEITLSDGKKISAELVLVSIGRAFNTENLRHLEFKFGNKGEIVVNEFMETNIEGVYAAGDVNGKWLLAHVAYREGEIAAKNALGARERMDYTVVPSTIFTVAEVASVGLKEREALEREIQIRKGTFPFRALGKAHAIGEIDGFIKILIDIDSDTPIGAHIIGPKASELIHELALAIKAKVKARDIKELIHSHPTLSEGIGEAAADLYGEAIHKLEK